MDLPSFEREFTDRLPRVSRSLGELSAAAGWLPLPPEVGPVGAPLAQRDRELLLYDLVCFDAALEQAVVWLRRLEQSIRRARGTSAGGPATP